MTSSTFNQRDVFYQLYYPVINIKLKQNVLTRCY